MKVCIITQDSAGAWSRYDFHKNFSECVISKFLRWCPTSIFLTHLYSFQGFIYLQWWILSTISDFDMASVKHVKQVFLFEIQNSSRLMFWGSFRASHRIQS